MIEMVASGAMSAILSTVLASSSLSSIFTMSFHSISSEDTWIPMLMEESMLFSFTLRILMTFSACPHVMWSMTVPFLMGGSMISLMFVFPVIRSHLRVSSRGVPS